MRNQSGSPRSTRRSLPRRRRLAWLLTSCVLAPGWLGLLGCNSMGGNKNNATMTSDPLLGGGTPISATRSSGQAPPQGVAAANTTTPPPLGNGLPPLQAPTGAPSTAALAAATARPLDPNNTLRIGDPRAAAATSPASPTSPGSPAPIASTGGWVAQGTTPQPGAVLRQPQGLADTGVRPPPGANGLPTSSAPIGPPIPIGGAPVGLNNQAPISTAPIGPPVVQPNAVPNAQGAFAPAPAAVAANGSKPVTTEEQLQAQLTAKGVRWQRLENGANGEWKFICSVPSKQNPNMARTYDASARDRTSAIQAVLEQIERDKN